MINIRVPLLICVSDFIPRINKTPRILDKTVILFYQFSNYEKPSFRTFQ